MCRADPANLHIRRFTMFDLIIVFLFVIADFTEFKDKYLIIEKFVPSALFISHFVFSK